MGVLGYLPSLNNDPFFVQSGYKTANGKNGLNRFIFGNKETMNGSSYNNVNHSDYISKLTFEQFGGIENTYIPNNSVKETSRTYRYCFEKAKKGLGRPYAYSVLPNCTGFAAGAFNKAYCQHMGIQEQWVHNFTGDASSFIYFAPKGLTILSRYDDPPLGGIAQWSGGMNGWGHVAFIEDVYPEIDSNTGATTDIVARIWESAWGSGYWIRTSEIRKSNGYAHGNFSSDDFEGFIANPAVIGSYVSTGAFIGNSFSTPYIFDGSTWKKATPYIFNGSEWKKCKRSY